MNLYLNRGWFLYIIGVTIEGAVCGSEDVAAGYDGASAIGFHLSSCRYQTHLIVIIILYILSCSHNPRNHSRKICQATTHHHHQLFKLFPSIDWGHHFKLSAAQVTIYYFTASLSGVLRF